MLNQEKIKAMTKAAIYESHEGKDDLRINEYSDGDYVRYNMLKTLIGVTISFMLICVLYLIYTSEDIFSSILDLNFVALGKLLLLIYVLTIAVYAIISIAVYQYRYSKSMKNIKNYEKLLDVIEGFSKQAADEDLGGNSSVD